MNETEVFQTWCQKLKELGITASLFGQDLRKVYLFAICAEQSGLLEECHAKSIESKTASEDVLHLYKMILDLNDNQETNFRRSASRVGSSFEVSVYPPLVEGGNACVTNENLEQMRENGLIHSVYSSSRDSYQDMEGFLAKVLTCI